MANDVSLTQRLQLFLQGDRGAVDALLREVLPKLHEIAVREVNRERYIAPVSATELINEVWLRNMSRGGWEIRDRGHFYAIASLAMRRVLVDLARNRLAQSRGGGQAAISLDEAVTPFPTTTKDAQQIVEIGLLMERLEVADASAARVVDMHYFGGFTLEEISAHTGWSFRQVRSRWEKGREWLKSMLKTKGA